MSWIPKLPFFQANVVSFSTYAYTMEGSGKYECLTTELGQVTADNKRVLGEYISQLEVIHLLLLQS